MFNIMNRSQAFVKPNEGEHWANSWGPARAPTVVVPTVVVLATAVLATAVRRPRAW
jgi:hypothetical protein